MGVAVQTKRVPTTTTPIHLQMKPLPVGGQTAFPPSWQKPALGKVQNWPPQARSLGNTLGQTPQLLIQRAVSGAVNLGVPDVQQSNTNLCWAATGLSVHQYLTNTQPGEQAFVTAQGSAKAKRKYAANKVCDIDDIIGSLSATNSLAGSDSSGSFSKSVIGRELNNGNLIIANVNGDHYIIICGKRSVKGTGWQLQIMDPGTGTKTWVNTDAGGKTASAGQYDLTVLYYTT
jgi:hypothetical protein